MKKELFNALHVLFILYVLVGGFIGPKILYFWVTTALIVHWMTGSRVCCLTMMTGNENSFLYDLIDPVYNLEGTISDDEFRGFIFWATVILWAQNLLRQGPVFNIFAILKDQDEGY